MVRARNTSRSATSAPAPAPPNTGSKYLTDLAMLETAELDANVYNPNRLTEEELAQYEAAARELGHLPKPVVVRRAGERYEIVDGQHGVEIANRIGWSEVPCEIIDADDFDAMRETYLRNRQGRNDPVRLARLFRAMMKDRKLSKRELANELHQTSEGTVRNALMYAEAVELRNRYAREPDTSSTVAESVIAKLHVRQVRAYIKLPDDQRDAWLDAGADLSKLAKWPAIKKPARRKTQPQSFATAGPAVDVARDTASSPEQRLTEPVIAGEANPAAGSEQSEPRATSGDIPDSIASNAQAVRLFQAWSQAGAEAKELFLRHEPVRKEIDEIFAGGTMPKSQSRQRKG